MRLAPLAMLLVACGRDTGKPAAAADSTSAAVSVPAVTRVNEPCRPTGNWEVCSVVYRLDRAGLVPRADTGSVTEPPLVPRGTLVRVGTAELELYFYASVAERERAQASLPRDKYVRFDQPLTTQSQPTLIYNANLIAILFSRNDHLRERVSDALTAGPPQPPTP